MIPSGNDGLSQDFVFKEKPTRTMRIRREQDRISGHIDNLKAMEQAVYIILSVERYDYIIHSWNFGVELKELFGKPISYCKPEVERRIKAALLQDSRITDVYDFEFEHSKDNGNRNKLFTKFRVATIFGDIEASKEVVV